MYTVAQKAAAERELRRRRKASAPRWYAPHPPSAQQQIFLALDCREAFYGGAAGGGKSDALLMAALQYVHVPGYAALILRQSYADLSLPGALLDRAHEWLSGSHATWNGQTKTWTFPSGATLTFGYLAAENDKYRYKSSEFQFVGFDELTQFSESQYRYLFSRIRKPEEGPLSEVSLRMRSASNPGEFGHEWVKRRFVIRSEENKDRIFIPAKLDDNPGIDKEAYRKNLYELEPAIAAQLEAGDWNIAAGQFFNHWDEKIHVCAPFAIPNDWEVWAALDYGFAHPTAVCVLTRDNDGVVYVIGEHVQSKWLPSEHAIAINALLERLGMSMKRIRTFVAGHDVFAARGDSQGKTIAEQYRDAGIVLVPAQIDRINGAAELLRRLGKPALGQPATLKVWSTCPRTIACIPAMQHDPRRPEDVLKVDANSQGDGGDDEYDSARYGVMVKQMGLTVIRADVGTQRNRWAV